MLREYQLKYFVFPVDKMQNQVGFVRKSLILGVFYFIVLRIVLYVYENYIAS